MYMKKLRIKEIKVMAFLRWIGGVIVFFWLLGFALRLAGRLLNLLLIVAVIVFLVDFLFGKNRH